MLCAVRDKLLSSPSEDTRISHGEPHERDVFVLPTADPALLLVLDLLPWFRRNVHKEASGVAQDFNYSG